MSEPAPSPSRTDPTLRNLVQAVHEKMSLSARYEMFEYEANTGGHPSAAMIFRHVALHEQDDIHTLLDALADELMRRRADQTSVMEAQR